jgi:hypothetical protein
MFGLSKAIQGQSSHVEAILCRWCGPINCRDVLPAAKVVRSCAVHLLRTVSKTSTRGCSGVAGLESCFLDDQYLAYCLLHCGQGNGTHVFNQR